MGPSYKQCFGQTKEQTFFFHMKIDIFSADKDHIIVHGRANIIRYFIPGSTEMMFYANKLSYLFIYLLLPSSSLNIVILTALKFVYCTVVRYLM